MKKIIFDTDIGGDCDDSGALAILHECHKAGLCNLLAVTISTPNPFSAGHADAINRHYGRVIPVGQTLYAMEERFLEWHGKYIFNHFDHSYKNSRAEDAVRLLRRLLAENEGEKISIVVVGSSANIKMLMQSEGDDISPLTGIQLMEKSVRELDLMGCYFPDKDLPEVWFGEEQMLAEFNIKEDVPAAQFIFDECPVPIFVSHYTVGWFIRTGKKLMEKEPNSPVSVAYREAVNGPRESWDPVASYFCVFGADGFFTLSPAGKVTIDDEGVSTFQEKEGGKHFLIGCKDYERATARLDDVMCGEI